MVNESFLTSDKGFDVWEYEDESENKRKLGVKDELDTMVSFDTMLCLRGPLQICQYFKIIIIISKRTFD